MAPYRRDCRTGGHWAGVGFCYFKVLRPYLGVDAMDFPVASYKYRKPRDLTEEIILIIPRFPRLPIFLHVCPPTRLLTHPRNDRGIT